MIPRRLRPVRPKPAPVVTIHQHESVADLIARLSSPPAPVVDYAPVYGDAWRIRWDDTYPEVPGVDRSTLCEWTAVPDRAFMSDTTDGGRGIVIPRRLRPGFVTWLREWLRVLRYRS